jgi:Putative DNA-binding domain
MTSADRNWIERLLYESEGDALDFKRDQYPFAGATDEQKSELLKDILAFANSWRRTDAYILIGVEEVQAVGPKLVGVSSHPDDADLQQFVNSKTQKPVQFAYHTVLVDVTSIGVIHIPLQHRPIFLKKTYGKLKANAVYLRRGSSTAEALPDEIAQMGAAEHSRDTAIPRLSFHFGNSATRSIEGVPPKLNVAHVSAPAFSDIPDYGGSGGWEVLNRSNREFNRQLIEYYRVRTSMERVGFALRNDGQILAENASVELQLPDVDHELQLSEHSDLPDRPKPTYDLIPEAVARFGKEVEDVEIRRLQDEWLVIVHFGRIRPRETVWARDPIWIGARSSRELTVSGRIFADNVPDPIPCELHLSFEVTDLTLSLESAMQAFVKELE